MARKINTVSLHARQTEALLQRQNPMGATRRGGGLARERHIRHSARDGVVEPRMHEFQWLVLQMVAVQCVLRVCSAEFRERRAATLHVKGWKKDLRGAVTGTTVTS